MRNDPLAPPAPFRAMLAHLATVYGPEVAAAAHEAFNTASVAYNAYQRGKRTHEVQTIRANQPKKRGAA